MLGLKPKVYNFEGNLKDLILVTCRFGYKHRDLWHVLFVPETERRVLLKYLRSKDLYKVWKELDTGILFTGFEYVGGCNFRIFVSSKICPEIDTRKNFYYVNRYRNRVRLEVYNEKDIKIEFSLIELEKLNICEFLSTTRKLAFF